MVAMDVAAEKATELPRLGKPRMKLNVHASHTDHKTRLFPDSGYYAGGTRNGRTGTDRRAPPSVDFVQELGPWDRAIAAEGVHHARIRCYGKGPART
jgi:hypothetical protein